MNKDQPCLRTVVYFRMQRFLDLGDSFDSCITATLTLFLSSTTPSSVRLFPISLALSFRTLNVLSSLICLVSGAGDRGSVSGGDCWDYGTYGRSPLDGGPCYEH